MIPYRAPHKLVEEKVETLAYMTSTSTSALTLQTAGLCDGAEVVQLYISYPRSPPLQPAILPQVEAWKFDMDMTDFPVKVLRGFEKVFLKQGETKRVEFSLTRRDLSYWDVTRQNWVMPTLRGVYD